MECQVKYVPVTFPVDGARLAGAIWEPSNGDESAPVVLAVHGITASHLSETVYGFPTFAADIRNMM